MSNKLSIISKDIITGLQVTEENTKKVYDTAVENFKEYLLTELHRGSDYNVSERILKQIVLPIHEEALDNIRLFQDKDVIRSNYTRVLYLKFDDYFTIGNFSSNGTYEFNVTNGVNQLLIYSPESNRDFKLTVKDSAPEIEIKDARFAEVADEIVVDFKSKKRIKDFTLKKYPKVKIKLLGIKNKPVFNYLNVYKIAGFFERIFNGSEDIISYSCDIPNKLSDYEYEYTVEYTYKLYTGGNTIDLTENEFNEFILALNKLYEMNEITENIKRYNCKIETLNDIMNFTDKAELKEGEYTECEKSRGYRKGDDNEIIEIN